MAKADRTGKRKRRESATRRVPDLGYYIVVTDAKETERNYLYGLRDSLPKELQGRTVAEASGVSRATLYENEKLRIRIESLRAVKLNKTSERDVEQQRRAQEKDLRRQIEILKEEKEMLIAQLVEMDRVMQENQHLKKVLASKKRE